MLSKKNNNTLSGKAMLYALFLILLMSIITASFISVSHLNHARLEDDFGMAHLERNLNSGMELIKSIEQSNFVSQELDLYGKKKDSITIEKFPWGIYDIAVAKGTYRTPLRNHAGTKAALMGSKADDILSAALYLVDKNRSLSLAGRTLIRGDAYLPIAGVKRASVNGIHFMGERLVEGTEKRSRRRLPKIDTNRVNHLISLFDQREGISLIPRTLKQSFADSTVFITGQNLLLDQYDLQGNIIIQATEAIHIAKECLLEDVIVVAPSISVENGFNGNVQLIALDEIFLEEGVSLSHPSSIVLLKTAVSMEKSNIQMKEGSFVHGAVVILDQKKSEDKAILRIEENSIIDGMAYIDGQVELKGKIKGHITLNSFYLKTASTTYGNYLFNSTINREALSEYFLFPPFMEGMLSNEFIKQLDI